ncbi:hypothetical protein HOY80DRAFT_986207 [Tuber brumale]|nr:hypothetical protein HOY80DRAFT_986207 [Tuber brumale]
MGIHWSSLILQVCLCTLFYLVSKSQSNSLLFLSLKLRGCARWGIYAIDVGYIILGGLAGLVLTRGFLLNPH